MGSEPEGVQSPIVTLPQGKLKGIVQTDGLPQPVECFLGCPYAQPPVGALRFRPPAALEPSTETFDASSYGKAAPGNPLIPPRIPLVYGEDCLTVNIFRPRPKHADGTLLPVLVYIHGGAFNRGNSSMQNTASMVAWSEQPFVAVSFNYRVGALGFLPSRRSAEEGILNLGFQDQRFLLHWVQDNIHAFGGDKHNVTLMGLSAGAIAIGHLILHYSDDNPGPFHRAIIQSGSAMTRDCRRYDADAIERYFQDFLAATGCRQDLPAADTFDFLRKLPLSVISAAQDTVFNKYKATMQWAFRPVIDGDIIRQAPTESWRQQRYYKIPILTGFCSHEGSLYVDKTLSKPEQFTQFMRVLLPSLPDEDIARLDALYPDPSTGDPTYQDERVSSVGIWPQFMRTEAAYGQFALIAPVRQTAHYASSLPGAPPVYLYHWDVWTTLLNGAAHADNLKYETYDQETTSLSGAQKEVSGMFHAYLTSFICNDGDPNKLRGRYKHRPEWKPYTPDQPLTMVLGKGNRELVGGDAGMPAELVHETCYDEQCQFWWERTPITQR
ncbi:hypothetical protein Z517_06005 [Fonsecaea pedrosoi CBS 271.37]|uniref:Carboxylic ester hydrolase n=1 Tax=Fonsecaea pedrosoi CBS 271.37 TaxID=1442368 RepID=A0A0D2GF16_9EURO|nr:uncharacterized protein Z517_06005 [Fonsecaea pedrosoi CBS 271.37]KIW79393.1 hypothetical protein Z517_06005 [Fonsecaea pedrosoi CBS 271.37]